MCIWQDIGSKLPNRSCDQPSVFNYALNARGINISLISRPHNQPGAVDYPQNIRVTIVPISTKLQ